MTARHQVQGDNRHFLQQTLQINDVVNLFLPLYILYILHTSTDIVSNNQPLTVVRTNFGNVLQITVSTPQLDMAS